LSLLNLLLLRSLQRRCRLASKRTSRAGQPLPKVASNLDSIACFNCFFSILLETQQGLLAKCLPHSSLGSGSSFVGTTNRPTQSAYTFTSSSYFFLCTWRLGVLAWSRFHDVRQASPDCARTASPPSASGPCRVAIRMHLDYLLSIRLYNTPALWSGILTIW